VGRQAVIAFEAEGGNEHRLRLRRSSSWPR